MSHDRVDRFTRRAVLGAAGGLVAAGALWQPRSAGGSTGPRLELVDGATSVIPSVGYPGRGQVAITFDDGPHRTVTDQVMRILARYGVPATWFVMGIKAETLPDVTRRIGWNGHIVQVHSWNHRWLTSLSAAEIQADLQRTSRTIKRLTGRTPTAFRPPYGATSPRVARAAAAVGLRQVMWNAGPSTTTRTSASALKQTLQHVAAAKQKGQGVTVLLHDGTGYQPVMLGMLAPLLAELRKRGWSFVRLT